MGILNNPAILRIRVPFQDFQPMEILNLELLVKYAAKGLATEVCNLVLRGGSPISGIFCIPKARIVTVDWRKI